MPRKANQPIRGMRK